MKAQSAARKTARAVEVAERTVKCGVRRAVVVMAGSLSWFEAPGRVARLLTCRQGTRLDLTPGPDRAATR
jgi:hypothetical protein